MISSKLALPAFALTTALFLSACSAGTETESDAPDDAVVTAPEESTTDSSATEEDAVDAASEGQIISVGDTFVLDAGPEFEVTYLGLATSGTVFDAYEEFDVQCYTMLVSVTMTDIPAGTGPGAYVAVDPVFVDDAREDLPRVELLDCDQAAVDAGWARSAELSIPESDLGVAQPQVVHARLSIPADSAEEPAFVRTGPSFEPMYFEFAVTEAF